MTVDNIHAAFIRACEDELSAIYDSVPGILFYIVVEPDGEFRFLSVSHDFLVATGLTRAQVVGSLVRDVIPTPSRDMVLNHYREAIRSRRPVRWKEASLYPAGQRHGEVAVMPLYDANGVATHLIGIVHDITQAVVTDITERKRADALLSRLAAIVEQSEDAIISKNLEGIITSWNAGAERLFGYKEKEVIGHPITILFSPELLEDENTILETLRAGGQVERYDTVRVSKAGKKIDIWVSTSPIKDSSGKIEGFSTIARDISERKRAEEALASATRKLIEAQEQERRRIGRELHDDINQRLAMLAVELEQLKESPSEVESRVEELRKQTTEISNDVQALSHELHSSKLEYLGAIGGMKSWCKEFAERQKIEIDCKLDVQSTLPHEIGLSLFRVLQEALHNAAKHSGVKRIEVELHEQAGEIRLTIRDLGKGFDIEAARQGRGLGLTSMQERVRLVNATIMIESKPMGGTTIHVRVPLESQQVSQRAAG